MSFRFDTSPKKTGNLSLSKDKDLKKQSEIINDPQIKKKTNILTDPNFDLFTHLKYNIKNTSSLCELHESTLVSYCLGCKTQICEVCITSIHSYHQSIKKDEYPQSPMYFNKFIEDFELEVLKVEEQIKPEKLVKTYKSSIDKEMDELIDKLKELKQKRLKEVDNLFVSSSIDLKKLKLNIKNSKEKLNKYFSKHKDFIDLKIVEDIDNFLFLQNFDLMNELFISINNYLNLISNLKNTYANFENISDPKFTEITKSIDHLLLNQKKKEIRLANEKIWESINSYNQNPDINNIDVKADNRNEGPGATLSNRLFSTMQKLNEDLLVGFCDKIDIFDSYNENFKTIVFDSIKKKQFHSEINKMVKCFEEKIGRKIVLSSGSRKINLNKSTLRSKKQIASDRSLSIDSHSIDKKSKFQSVDKSKFSVTEENDNILNKEDEYKISINANTMKTNNKIDKDRNNIFKTVDKVFRPKPKAKIDKVVNAKNKEMKKTIDPENALANNNEIEEKRPQSQDKKYKINTHLAETIQENVKILKLITSREKVTLTISTIRKFYSFHLIDFFRNLKESTDNSMKSNLDIFEKNVIDNDPLLNTVVKVIEGTDEIHIYYKNTKRLEKRKIEIDPKKFNTKVFFKGSRWCHLQGKLYICGGKDFNGDKNIFMVYNFKENKLTRLMDMKYPRSFHTVIFHENIRALIALGGENNNSCEIYDFYLNIWSDFPELNYSRANISLLVNDEGTFAYAMFGLVGDIVNKKLTDVIEVIDLIDMNKGWYKLDYTNNTGVDLKTYELKLEFIPGNKILIYGGAELRSGACIYLVFDLKTYEMHKVDTNQGELLRQDNELGISNYNTAREKFNSIGSQRSQPGKFSTKNSAKKNIDLDNKLSKLIK